MVHEKNYIVGFMVCLYPLWGVVCFSADACVLNRQIRLCLWVFFLLLMYIYDIATFITFGLSDAHSKMFFFQTHPKLSMCGFFFRSMNGWKNYGTCRYIFHTFFGHCKHTIFTGLISTVQKRFAATFGLQNLGAASGCCGRASFSNASASGRWQKLMGVVKSGHPTHMPYAPCMIFVNLHLT